MRRTEIGGLTALAETVYPVLDGEFRSMTVFAAGTARRVGTITLTSAHASAVYIGWYGESTQHGRGYMLDAVTQLTPRLFFHYHRVVAAIDSKNERSKNLARKAGFRYEGTAVKARFYAGRWHDLEFWALLEEDLS